MSSSRPLSPHLQIYKPELHMAMSITHRITGVLAFLGSLLLVAWVAAAASGAGVFNIVNGILSSWLGWIILFGWSVAMLYHLCNGVRHLVWDTGVGYEKETIKMSGMAVLAATAILTLLLWISVS